METRLDGSTIARSVEAIQLASSLEAISWAWTTFGDRCCVLSSMQETVVIELAMRVHRDLPIVFLDNGYHFDETLDTVRRVERRYGIEVQVIGPLEPVRDDIEPGGCCDLKPALRDAALADRHAWISGVRRSQTDHRSNMDLVTLDTEGRAKVNPIVQWNDADVARFARSADVIRNPLLDRGYTSIGCRTCTSVPTDADDARSGRWAGDERTECGLHVG